MELPLVAPAPVLSNHAAVFRDLCDHQGQCRHFQHDLTGLSVLPTKSLANSARGILDSAEKTNLWRVLVEAPWREDAVNRCRIRFMRQQSCCGQTFRDRSPTSFQAAQRSVRGRACTKVPSMNCCISEASTKS